MNASFKSRLLLVTLIAMPSLHGAMVTYEFSGGRFGDCLLAYLRAKWVAFKCGTKHVDGSHISLPIVYQPFKYSDQLVLDLVEKQNTSQRSHLRPRQQISLRSLAEVDHHRKYLYVVPYFSEAEGERNLPWNRHWNAIFFQVDWDNKQFYDEIKRFVRPINPKIEQFDLPNDAITVALHVRKGEGFDGPLLSDDDRVRPDVNYADLYVPLKFPPEHFFVEQLKTISRMYNHQKIYAYVFTDALSPASLTNRLLQGLSEFPNITLDYRKTYNFHDVNVLEDFFAMTKFDCLIRGESNFSIVAAKIANYKVEIYPIKQHWQEHRSIIDEVMVKTERKFH